MKPSSKSKRHTVRVIEPLKKRFYDTYGETAYDEVLLDDGDFSTAASAYTSKKSETSARATGGGRGGCGGRGGRGGRGGHGGRGGETSFPIPVSNPFVDIFEVLRKLDGSGSFEFHISPDGTTTQSYTSSRGKSSTSHSKASGGGGSEDSFSKRSLKSASKQELINIIFDSSDQELLGSAVGIKLSAKGFEVPKGTIGVLSGMGVVQLVDMSKKDSPGNHLYMKAA